MVKIKYILIALLIFIVGIWAITYFSQSEEKKVKKQFDLLSEWISKESGEDVFAVGQKMKNIGSLFDENCEIKIPAQSLSGTYPRDEISSYAVRGRLQFSQLHLKFYDLDIAFIEKGMSKVHLTARLTGRATTGENVNEAHELDCFLKKIENRWLFTQIEVVEVLKR
jgi:hypothetical protein